MNREIEIQDYDRHYTTQSFVFSGGELQVRIPDLPPRLVGNPQVLARLQSAEDVLRLLLTNDIITRHHCGARRSLLLPYMPYARQDRVMQHGEAFSLKAFAQLINGLGFDRVVVCDPHSDVTAGALDGLQVIDQAALIRNHPSVHALRAETDIVLVLPDSGAAKKGHTVAQALGVTELVQATKVRDVRTGQITDTTLDVQDNQLKGRTCLIVDDICDGGRTFIALARLLRRLGARRTYLYVTHGIFSQGFEVFENCLDGIFTTDTFLPEHVNRNPALPVDVFSVTGLMRDA